MAQKEAFLSLLKGDGIVGDWIERTVPDVPDLPTPGTVEESILSIAKYCDNCNKIMQQWEGVPLFEIYLRGGQRSSANQAMVLASLERQKGTDAGIPGVVWEDYIKVMGFAGDTPNSEHLKGIGGKYNAEDISDIYAALNTYGADMKAWLEGLAAQISAAEESYISGEEYILEFDAGTPPVIVLPDPIDVDNPSSLWQIIKIVSLALGNIWIPIVIEIAKALLRRAAQGEKISPLLKLLRKIFLVKEEDVDQDMPDYTSIILMMVERALHIIISNTGLNAFIEPVWFDDLPE